MSGGIKMLSGIEDCIILGAIAVAGTLYKQVYGFYVAKQKTPSLEFDVNYVHSTVISAVTIFSSYVIAGDSIALTGAMAVTALLSGMGGQELITKANKLLPTPGKNV
jgi:hypothetical protein